MTADLQRSLHWSFPGFVLASALLLPLAARWQQALLAKLGFANPLTTAVIEPIAVAGGTLLVVATAFTCWKAITILDKEHHHLGERCLIFWNTLVMLFAALGSITAVPAALYFFLQ